MYSVASRHDQLTAEKLHMTRIESALNLLLVQTLARLNVMSKPVAENGASEKPKKHTTEIELRSMKKIVPEHQLPHATISPEDVRPILKNKKQRFSVKDHSKGSFGSSDSGGSKAGTSGSSPDRRKITLLAEPTKIFVPIEESSSEDTLNVMQDDDGYEIFVKRTHGNENIHGKGRCRSRKWCRALCCCKCRT